MKKELACQILDECVKLAEKYGLSAMTMDEITDEVKAVRREARLLANEQTKEQIDL
ncbi:hypothetical protein Barb6_03644 [Bacteroidales bacterium Barb6]|nr:hypothetical protein Barb6_03644 [Bacteroidales bacterium Barb6]OAV73755.1 hypothetical protein Barb7_02874 [Bacteroidales bacterium Barb7]